MILPKTYSPFPLSAHKRQRLHLAKAIRKNRLFSLLLRSVNTFLSGQSFCKKPQPKSCTTRCGRSRDLEGTGSHWS